MRRGLHDSLDSQTPAPPITVWKRKCSFMGISLSYVPTIKTWFLNHWEVSLWMPILVMAIIYSSLSVFLSVQRRVTEQRLGFGFTIYLIVTAILFGTSYVMTIAVGPGYLPFYYPLRNPNGGENNYLSGMVTNDEQLYYVKVINLPPRTGYYKSVRRVVIRPDHLCGWTASFIGKKNHKLFFLFNFWGVMYIIPFAVSCCFTISILAENNKYIMGTLLSVIYAVLALLFGLLTGTFTTQMIYEISLNKTVIEGKRKEKRRSNGFISNWEEIFGPRRQWYLWLIPVRAFGVNDDTLLIGDQENDDDGDRFLL